jgi:DnaK suppressor protein
MSGAQEGREILALPDGIAVEDQAPLMHEQFVALRQQRMDGRKLKLIDAALERLDSGDFGICDNCGERISDKRLEALPWAAYCVQCQTGIDRREASEAGPALEMIA